MTISICPHCNRRFVSEDGVDFSHECNSRKPVLDNEDILIVGNWTDFTGSGTENNVNMQGSANLLFGTRADIEGEDQESVTRRGVKASTHRQRQHLEFIKLQGGEK